MTGRFAPTPSGRMHIGNVYAMLGAWLSARKTGDSIRLRIEDIDEPRVVPNAAETMMHDLDWLGLNWDGEPVFQQRDTPYIRKRSIFSATSTLTKSAIPLALSALVPTIPIPTALPQATPQIPPAQRRSSTPVSAHAPISAPHRRRRKATVSPYIREHATDSSPTTRSA